MPLQATSGAASYDAFGGNGVAVVPTYIEEVFSTYLYTGNGTSQTITNNIDVSTKGGLVWLKSRSNSQYHGLWDTLRGPTHALNSALTNAQYTTTSAQDLTGFTSSGFTVGTYWNNSSNQNDATYASWTFRKQPKFFDVVTYTGTGSNTTIAHSLGAVPACIIVKRTDTTGNWQVYHRSLANTEYLVLNTTDAKATGATRWNSTTPTSTVFSLGTDATVNASGGTYVAYVFAHDAGGFGLSGTDNVISCGSYTTDGSGNATVNLGYEPQWVLFKASSRVLNWSIHDTMRGMPVGSVASGLYPNLSDAESNNVTTSPTSTGFTWSGYANETFIYVAIRRGPMKVPTTGTSVFSTNIETTSGSQTLTTNFPVDFNLNRDKNSVSGWYAVDRLRGVSSASFPYLLTNTTAAEATGSGLAFDSNIGIVDSSWWTAAGATYWSFRRAPSFFDEVCYTGTGSSMSITHNLGVGPELVIVKRRNSTSDWQVAAKINSTEYTVGASGNELALNSSGGGTTTYFTYATYFSSTAFQTGAFWTTPNVNGGTYVAYLFSTCAGVSKVGIYTGTATTLQIDCGFTAGARFVLIKRTDSTGAWYVWDTARGIVSGNDPYLLLNSTAAEVTNTDYIDTYSAGFEISSTAPAAINASAGTFLFLAIAQT